MQHPKSYPQSVLVGGFNEETNNTDKSVNDIIKKSFEGEEMTFSPSNAPT